MSTANDFVLELPTMPRSLRTIEAGGIYHVINRGNGKRRIFRKDEDYQAFLKVLAGGLKRHPVELLAFCVLSNHWHLLLWPKTDAALPKLLAWITVTHARRYHQHYKTPGSGHVYQGRYKSFPVQDDEHFLTVARYIEANALRAGVVPDARKWRWCSLAQREFGRSELPLSIWPMDRPRDWASIVNQVMEPDAINQIHQSVIRGRPFGSMAWMQRTAARLGLKNTMNPMGRPRKPMKELSNRQKHRRIREENGHMSG
jgi:putative transposase